MNQISPNVVTFASHIYTKNAFYISRRHFREVPSGIEPL